MGRPPGRSASEALILLRKRDEKASFDTLIRHAAAGEVEATADLIMRLKLATYDRMPERIEQRQRIYRSQSVPAQIWELANKRNPDPARFRSMFVPEHGHLVCSRRQPPFHAQDRTDRILAEANKIELSSSIPDDDELRKSNWVRRAYGDYDPIERGAIRKSWPAGYWTFEFYYVYGIKFLNSPVFGHATPGRGPGRQRRASLKDDLAAEKIAELMQNDPTAKPYVIAAMFVDEADHNNVERASVTRRLVELARKKLTQPS